MPKSGKVLGIDYGNVRIGVALSDEDGIIAFPKESIKNTSKSDVLKRLKQLVEAENAKEIIVGMPYSMEGDKSDQTKLTEKFVDFLKVNINIPVEIYDERLTSIESDVILNTLRLRGHKRKTERDIIAASLILQNYLELKRNKGKKGKQGEHISLKNK
jgi:putative Holliday junction resolvase